LYVYVNKEKIISTSVAESILIPKCFGIIDIVFGQYRNIWHM